MITKEDFFNILNDKICPICKGLSKIKGYNHSYDCINCKIFYFGEINNFPHKTDIYFGYKYDDGHVFVFNLLNNDIRMYFANNRKIHIKINIFSDKIPESIEDLDNLYLMVEKNMVFQ